jgi:phosphatidate cytidylyltransferase
LAAATRKSDLAVRTVSAAVLLAIAGTALWFGGSVLQFFIALIAFIVVLEWRGLVVRFPDDQLAKSIWMAVGGLYVALACGTALLLAIGGLFIPLIGSVIGTDVGAYFAGRMIGGPKIAPAISPSKTWAGLFGGMAGAALLLNGAVLSGFGGSLPVEPARLVALGCGLAVVAQTGDFFESWLKRRAGVKDSGTLIPGHGGMFDRVDGLLPVCIVAFVLFRNMGLMP